MFFFEIVNVIHSTVSSLAAMACPTLCLSFVKACRRGLVRSSSSCSEVSWQFISGIPSWFWGKTTKSGLNLPIQAIDPSDAVFAFAKCCLIRVTCTSIV